jgi:aminoglycoside 3-N-acetyltransferase
MKIKIKKRIKQLEKKKKKFNIWLSKNVLKNMSTTQQLVKDLNTSRLKEGDKVMVHSSLSSIGVLENGAQSVVDALKTVITKSGLLVMPTFIGFSMYDYLENYKIWDVSKSRSYTGAITECFRKNDNVIRSLHPTHSLSAWGSGAEEFVTGHEKSITPFDEESPYRKLIDQNFKILFIGLDLFSMTLCRAGDDYIENYPENPYLDKTYELPIIDYSGHKIKIKTKCHNPEISKRRRNMLLFPYLKEKIIVGKFGETHTLLVNAMDVIQIQKDLALSNKSVYGSPDELKNIDEIQNDFKNYIKKGGRT